MYSYPSQESGIAPRVCTPQADAWLPSIDFYPSSADDEAPLTGRALRDVLEAGSRAATAMIAGGRGRQGVGRLSLRDANPLLLALLRASPSGPASVAREGLPLPAQNVDPFAGLSEADIALIGPVSQAALRRYSADAPACSEMLEPPPTGDAGLSAEVMHYLRTLQTEVASTMGDSGAVTMDDALAHEATETNGRLATSLIDGLLSDIGRPVAAADTAESSVSSALLQQNPLLLEMLEAPMVTASAYDAYRLPPAGDGAFADAAPSLQHDWRRDARAYTVMTETISEASTPSSPISAVEAEGGTSYRQPTPQPTPQAQAQAQPTSTPTLTLTPGQVLERARGTANLLRVLGAVVRRDMTLPPLPKNTSEVHDAVARYDPRYLLCAAYRAIILNVPGKHAWLPLQRFTDALNLDLSTFTRWTARYRLEDGPPNAFWETLAPHTWIDAFAVIDALEAGRRGPVPTVDDLAMTALYGRLQLGRGKPLGTRSQHRVNAWLDGIEQVAARSSGSGAQPGATDTDTDVTANGAAVPVAAVSTCDNDGSATPVLATAVSLPGEPAVTSPIADPLRRTAWRIRLLAAAASGAILLERIESLEAPMAASVRRYDPRYLLMAAYEALAERFRVGGNTLRLRTFSLILGLVPRTVYAWRTAYVRNRRRGAAFGRRIVAGSGTDHSAFITGMNTAMREPAPVLADLRATSLHDRLLGLYECTLKTSAREKKPKGTGQSGAPRGVSAASSVPPAPRAASGSGDTMQSASCAPPFAAVPAAPSAVSAAGEAVSEQCAR